MVDPLISFLIAIVIFAVIAYGMYWVCTHFFPNFAPALWICGVILLIIILMAVSGRLGGGFVPVFHK